MADQKSRGGHGEQHRDSHAPDDAEHQPDMKKDAARGQQGKQGGYHGQHGDNHAERK